MSQHIQIRQWAPGYDTETPVIAEVFWDPTAKRFGVYSVPENQILWYPALTTGLMNLLGNQQLSGLLAVDNSQNDLAFDFSTKDAIRIVSASTGRVVAQFSLSGTTYESTIVTGAPKFNYLNQLINSGLNKLRTLQSAPLGPWNANQSYQRVCVAPNWQLFSSSGLGGLTCSFSNADLPPAFPTGRAAVVSTGAVNAAQCGLRSFIHRTDDLIGQTLNASVWIKGPAGQQSYVRVLSPDYVYVYQPVMTTGQWQQISYAFTIQKGTTPAYNFVAFDMLYNPSGANLTWLVAHPQITQGAALLPNEARSGEFEHALIRSIFDERKMDVQMNVPFYMPLSIMGGYTVIEGFNVTHPTVSLGSFTTDDFGSDMTFGDPSNSATTGLRVSLTAYRAPILTQ